MNNYEHLYVVHNASGFPRSHHTIFHKAVEEAKPGEFIYAYELMRVMAVQEIEKVKRDANG